MDTLQQVKLDKNWKSIATTSEDLLDKLDINQLEIMTPKEVLKGA